MLAHKAQGDPVAAALPEGNVLGRMNMSVVVVVVVAAADSYRKESWNMKVELDFERLGRMTDLAACESMVERCLVLVDMGRSTAEATHHTQDCVAKSGWQKGMGFDDPEKRLSPKSFDRLRLVEIGMAESADTREERH